MTSDFTMRFAAVALLGLSLSACSSLGTSVAEDDSETELPNSSLGRAVMESLGAVPSRSTPINFQPRAPLVVPPSTTALAPPEPRNQITSVANWPEDQDLAEARRLREAAAREGGAIYEDNAAISGSQLLATRLPPGVAADRRRERPRNGINDSDGRIVPSTELAGFRSQGIDDSGVYDRNGNPQRRALVEPPVEYLQPAAGTPVAIPEDPEKSKRGIMNWLKW